MRFEIIHIFGSNPGTSQHRTHQIDLTFNTRNGQTSFATTIGIRPGGKNNAMNTITISNSPIKWFQQQYRSTFGTLEQGRVVVRPIRQLRQFLCAVLRAG
ncbi:MAG TPA: hypothetical protein PLI90_12605 [Rhodocyclaceae bacterium]|nr:hypothetical protein [Rhodocyclaceae bacterium]